MRDKKTKDRANYISHEAWVWKVDFITKDELWKIKKWGIME